jgi:hypothetical protein
LKIAVYGRNDCQLLNIGIMKYVRTSAARTMMIHNDEGEAIAFCVKFGVFKAVTMKNAIFWDVMQCGIASAVLYMCS